MAGSRAPPAVRAAAVVLVLFLVEHVRAESSKPKMIAYAHIPPALKARLSNLKESAIDRYKSYLTDKSMPLHSEEFCKESGLICRENEDDLSVLLHSCWNGVYKLYSGSSRRNAVNSLFRGHRRKFVIGFFRQKRLFKGSKILLHDLRNPVTPRAFLPLALSSLLPFSTIGLPELLSVLNISRGSMVARRMAFTLEECQPRIEDGFKFCATSAEELFRLASDEIGPEFRIMETSSSEGSQETVELMDVYLRASTDRKVIACHDSPFPYTVFFCHITDNTKVYETSWVASNGNVVRAVAICHMDTSDFDPLHPSFAELHTQPGKSEVCHWLSESNHVWFSA